MVRIVPNGEITQLFNDRNISVGYVENGKLYGFTAKWDAVLICEIDHPSEIEAKLKEWQKLNLS